MTESRVKRILIFICLWSLVISIFGVAIYYGMGISEQRTLELQKRDKIQVDESLKEINVRENPDVMTVDSGGNSIVLTWNKINNTYEVKK